MSNDDFNDVAFPFNLTQMQLTDLFGYIGRTLPGVVEYQGAIKGRKGIAEFEDRPVSLETTVLTGGHIRFREGANGLSFTLHGGQTEEEISIYTGLSFDVIPGYNRQELLNTHTANPNDMDKVRNKIVEYFKV